jgi:hypothetical protein
LINGRTFPDNISPNGAPWLPTQPYGAMSHVYPYQVYDANGLAANPTPALIRYLAVGVEDYPMHPHSNHERVIMKDAMPLTDHTVGQPVITPGTTPTSGGGSNPPSLTIGTTTSTDAANPMNRTLLVNASATATTGRTISSFSYQVTSGPTVGPSNNSSDWLTSGVVMGPSGSTRTAAITLPNQPTNATRTVWVRATDSSSRTTYLPVTFAPSVIDLSEEHFAVIMAPGTTADVTFVWTNVEDYQDVNGKRVPVPVPGMRNLTDGELWSGSPYLGDQQTLNPGNVGNDQCGEYYHVVHSHDLPQATNYGATFGGMLTLIRVDPPKPASGSIPACVKH